MQNNNIAPNEMNMEAYAMKEIRLHGRGGQGVVKASHIVVKAAVSSGTHGQFIPFFGVERKGSPVFGFLRLSNEPIRRKTQVYEPDILMIFDDTLVKLPATYAGLKKGGTVIINSTKSIEALGVPAEAFIGDDIGKLPEAIHALFRIEEQFMFKPMLTSEGPALVAREFCQERDALRAWAQERARLDAGEITEEEYKDWKDAYVLPTTHVS